VWNTVSINSSNSEVVANTNKWKLFNSVTSSYEYVWFTENSPTDPDFGIEPYNIGSTYTTITSQLVSFIPSSSVQIAPYTESDLSGSTINNYLYELTDPSGSQITLTIPAPSTNNLYLVIQNNGETTYLISSSSNVNLLSGSSIVLNKLGSGVYNIKFVSTGTGPYVWNQIDIAGLDNENIIDTSNQKKKLLFYPGSLKTNGITSSIISLLNYIDYDKYDVTIILDPKKNLDFENFIFNLKKINNKTKIIFMSIELKYTTLHDDLLHSNSNM